MLLLIVWLIYRRDIGQWLQVTVILPIRRKGVELDLLLFHGGRVVSVWSFCVSFKQEFLCVLFDVYYQVLFLLQDVTVMTVVVFVSICLGDQFFTDKWYFLEVDLTFLINWHIEAIFLTELQLWESEIFAPDVPAAIDILVGIHKAALEWPRLLHNFPPTDTPLGLPLLGIVIQVLATGSLDGRIVPEGKIPEPVNDGIIELVLLEKLLPDRKLVVVVQDQLLDFVGGQPDALAEVHLDEDSHVAGYLGDLHQFCLRLQRQHLLVVIEMVLHQAVPAVVNLASGRGDVLVLIPHSPQIRIRPDTRILSLAILLHGWNYGAGDVAGWQLVRVAFFVPHTGTIWTPEISPSAQARTAGANAIVYLLLCAF